MQRLPSIVVFIAAVLCMQPLRAQAPPAAAELRSGYSFCTVIDMSGGGMGTAKIWASPIFAFQYHADDPAALERTRALASEFHRAMGGEGDKACHPATESRAELEAIRDGQRASLTKRTLSWASKWQEVAWTPGPWDPHAVAVAPAFADRYFYCYVTDVEPSVRKTVASLVFAMPVPGGSPTEAYAQATAYAEEFERTALVGQGVSEDGAVCAMKDTQAEAEKARKEYRRLFSGFNLRFVDLPWRPTGQSIASAEVAPAPSAPGAVEATAPATPLAPQTAPRRYCHAYLLHSGSAGGVRTPVWENAGSDGSVAAMSASLSSFIAHMHQAQAGVWGEFPAVTCNEGAGYCFATLPQRRGQEAQVAGQFCERSREAAEAGWKSLSQNAASMTLWAWPPPDTASAITPATR